MIGPNRWIADVVAAAEARGWQVIRFDTRAGLTLEEPVADGLVLTINGRALTPEFVESLPEARQPTSPVEGTGIPTTIPVVGGR